jgi:hypothetical protein
LKNKKLTNQEKLSFIIKTELKITEAISKGHRATDKDEFSDERNLMNKYKKELGLIK